MKKPHIPVRFVPISATILVFLLAYAIGIANFRNFGSLRVFLNLLHDNAYLGVAAIGAMVVILSGGIDLSVGSVIAFTGMLIAKMIDCGVNACWAILLAIVIGALFGMLQGVLISTFELPPFLVTLGGMFFARGCSYIVNEEAMGILNNPVFNFIENKLEIPIGSRGLTLEFIDILYLVMLIIAIVFTQRTHAGRCIYAVGENEQAATLMGIPVRRTKIMVYTIAGFCSAVAGIVFTIYLKSGNPLSCVGLEMDAIAATVIGGTLLTGGVGYMIGSFFGVLVLGLIQVLIMFQGNINSWWTRIIVGALVLVFIFMQNLITKISKKSKG